LREEGQSGISLRRTQKILPVCRFGHETGRLSKSTSHLKDQDSVADPDRPALFHSRKHGASGKTAWRPCGKERAMVETFLAPCAGPKNRAPRRQKAAGAQCVRGQAFRCDIFPEASKAKALFRLRFHPAAGLSRKEADLPLPPLPEIPLNPKPFYKLHLGKGYPGRSLFRIPC